MKAVTGCRTSHAVVRILLLVLTAVTRYPLRFTGADTNDHHRGGRQQLDPWVVTVVGPFGPCPVGVPGVDNAAVALAAQAGDVHLHAESVDEVPPPALVRRMTDVDQSLAYCAGPADRLGDRATRPVRFILGSPSGRRKAAGK